MILGIPKKGNRWIGIIVFRYPCWQLLIGLYWRDLSMWKGIR